jgi:hypothetical protein
MIFSHFAQVIKKADVATRFVFLLKKDLIS